MDNICELLFLISVFCFSAASLVASIIFTRSAGKAEKLFAFSSWAYITAIYGVIAFDPGEILESVYDRLYNAYTHLSAEERDWLFQRFSGFFRIYLAVMSLLFLTFSLFLILNIVKGKKKGSRGQAVFCTAAIVLLFAGNAVFQIVAAQVKKAEILSLANPLEVILLLFMLYLTGQSLKRYAGIVLSCLATGFIFVKCIIDVAKNFTAGILFSDLLFAFLIPLFLSVLFLAIKTGKINRISSGTAPLPP